MFMYICHTQKHLERRACTHLCMCTCTLIQETKQPPQTGGSSASIGISKAFLHWSLWPYRRPALEEAAHRFIVAERTESPEAYEESGPSGTVPSSKASWRRAQNAQVLGAQVFGAQFLRAQILRAQVLRTQVLSAQVLRAEVPRA